MDIVEEIRQDREKGAKRLESEYKAGLMALARRFCADSSDAEELVNATFATVIENIDDYLEQSAFFAWMCQILTSLHSRNVRRKSVRDIVYPGDVPDLPDENAQGAIYDHLDASLLRAAIDDLPKDQREALALHYFMDMSVVQIAKYLAVPTGTVMSRLHYARKALAAKLGAAAKRPGVKALLLALALCALTAVGAAVAKVATASDVATAPTPSARQPDACDGEGGATTLVPDGDGEDAAASTPHRPQTTWAPLSVTALFTSTLGETMIGETMRTSAKAAAGIAAASLAFAASGDGYQFIISGDPVAAAEVGVGAGESATGPLDVREHDVADSATMALSSIKDGATILYVR